MRSENPKIFPRSKTRGFLQKIKNKAREKGFLSVVVAGAKRIRRMVNNWFRNSFFYYSNRIFNSRRTFVFREKRYRYFYHKYNTTWRNERAVEIPIVRHIMQETTGEILEVGNVLSHYSETNHVIVDKYERAEGVLTQDITEIQTSKKYDLIISISTLEHVGWDENPVNHNLVNAPEKILQALSKMRELLKPKGIIFVTVAIGYNPYFDKFLKNGTVGFGKQFFMKRTHKGSGWVEAEWEEIKNAKFNRQIPAANAIIIGLVENEP